MAGAHRLLLTGSVPIPAGGKFVLPRLDVEGTQTNRRELHVYRTEDVLVEVAGTGRLTPIEDAERPAPPEFGQLVARYTLGPGKAELRVPPTRPAVSAHLVTTFLPSADGWEAELDYMLQVKSGLVDALRFEVPASWTGPYESDEDVKVRLVDLPGEK